ncbi:hypothetical protein GQ53DRAFT_516185 [Thozetella sp. PMI_491]|nr:hypothetical protein GQ53DRAFT_516185 [Thozetella sp. PMI_491]
MNPAGQSAEPRPNNGNAAFFFFFFFFGRGGIALAPCCCSSTPATFEQCTKVRETHELAIGKQAGRSPRTPCYRLRCAREIPGYASYNVHGSSA